MPKNPDYSLAQIYTIKSQKDETFLFVGSSCRELAHVLAKHIYDSKKRVNALYDRMNIDNWDDYCLQLYENYPCENAKQLRDREEALIKELGAFGLKIDSETKKEKLAQYYKDNHERITERQKKYERNKIKQAEYQRTYRSKKKAL